MYPAAMIEIASIGISPGDSITASVQYDVPGYTNEFQLSITDNRTHATKTYYETSTGTPLLSSAEWIVEAPTSSSILPLPDFGSVPFTNATATIDSTAGPIRRFDLADGDDLHGERQ